MQYVLSKSNRTFYMGLAIIWIVGYHILIFHESDFYGILRPFKYLFFEGYVGVDVFFFLSAYGLCHSFVQNKTIVFYLRRISRIMPEYLTFLLVCLIIFVPHDEVYEGVIGMIYQLTGVSAIISPPMFGGEWFTPAIINLYLLFPVIFVLVKKVSDRFGLFGQLSLLILCVITSNLFDSLVNGNYLNRFPVILMGLLTYLNEQNNDSKAMAFVYVLAAILSFFIERHGMRISLILPLILFGCNSLQFSTNAKVTNYVKRIGNYSFEIYLGQSVCLSLSLYLELAYVFVIMTFGTLICAYILHFAGCAIRAMVFK